MEKWNDYKLAEIDGALLHIIDMKLVKCISG